jgi:hypothetical protein
VARWRGAGKDKGLLVISEMLEEMIGSEAGVSDMLTFSKEEIGGMRGL